MDVVLNFVDFSPQEKTHQHTPVLQRSATWTRIPSITARSNSGMIRKSLLTRLRNQHEQTTQQTQMIKTEIMILEEELLTRDIGKSTATIDGELSRLEEQLSIEMKNLSLISRKIAEIEE